MTGCWKVRIEAEVKSGNNNNDNRTICVAARIESGDRLSEFSFFFYGTLLIRPNEHRGPS